MDWSQLYDDAASADSEEDRESVVSSVQESSRYLYVPVRYLRSSTF